MVGCIRDEILGKGKGRVEENSIITLNEYKMCLLEKKQIWLITKGNPGGRSSACQKTTDHFPQNLNLHE